MHSPRKKRLWILVGVFCAIYAVLLVPDPIPLELPSGDHEPFVWNQDAYWSLLEAGFKEVRLTDCNDLSAGISTDFAEIDSLLAILNFDTLAPDAGVFADIETAFFELAVFVAACPERLPDYVDAFRRLRISAKNQSTRWDMNSRVARDRIYRLLYGGRTAVEEVLLQSPTKIIPEVVHGIDEPSATPSATILGVAIHSGDILVSRGGAATSALIARGNDYPGNFSHAALAHVDEQTGDISIIEAHIEQGVAIAAVEDYFRDKKLRVMVLRLRSDLPALQADPMLPHNAAEFELARANAERIPYDFAMDSREFEKLFCSEVVLEAYAEVGIKLWSSESRVSDAGVKSWLGAFGVRNFNLEEPSDLEYDPQLRVVAEWRDFETLYDDHLDNTVVDVMLEGAVRGDRLKYDWFMLPPTRLAKAYSYIRNLFDKTGPVPEGMNATAALKNRWYTEKHQTIKAKLRFLADQFEQENGYTPPYWELYKLGNLAAETK